LMLPTPLIKRFLCNFLIVSHTSSNMYVWDRYDRGVFLWTTIT
jgi:hypothetical protein